MRVNAALVAPLVLVALGAGACARDERQWMKIGVANYTREEFQRDVKECSQRGTLDESCMKARGWVAVTAEREAPRDPRSVGQGPRY